ncbi:MAG: RluA family pseudouridine synthase [Bacteriovoracia bacterium]
MISIEWCALVPFASSEVLLKQVFKCSGQQLKKHTLDRKWLMMPIAARQVVQLPLALVNAKEIWPWTDYSGVAVVAEDEELLALHKPPGIHTHPLHYEPVPNLVSWLAAAAPKLTLVNAQGMDRGCVWRLDRETSGLVLYAKTDEAYGRLRSHFSQVFRRKLYWAIVEGDPGTQTKLTHFLSPQGVKGERMKVGATGQTAVLDYETVMTENGYSLVVVNLHSGLRHQIRVQLAAIGHPIVGDTFYGGNAAERLFLHCWRYETETKTFSDPGAELFERFFDLHRLLQVLHDKFR